MFGCLDNYSLHFQPAGQCCHHWITFIELVLAEYVTLMTRNMLDLFFFSSVSWVVGAGFICLSQYLFEFMTNI